MTMLVTMIYVQKHISVHLTHKHREWRSSCCKNYNDNVSYNDLCTETHQRQNTKSVQTMNTALCTEQQFHIINSSQHSIYTLRHVHKCLHTSTT